MGYQLHHLLENGDQFAYPADDRGDEQYVRVVDDGLEPFIVGNEVWAEIAAVKWETFFELKGESECI